MNTFIQQSKNYFYDVTWEGGLTYHAFHTKILSSTTVS